jgi:hypothetical protein
VTQITDFNFSGHDGILTLTPAGASRIAWPQNRGMTDLEAIAERHYCHPLEGQTDHVAYEAALDPYL